ncbi:hypothetical protein [Coleofasciculus chthonoplastes]|uniref:hypothetical protein n=1 Tax=Coleofasciculus chthonoplastes TaxID=64178 RepID=UPI0032FBB664
MAVINNMTRSKIKGYLEGFIQGLVNEYKGREIVQPDSASEPGFLTDASEIN